VTDLRSLADAYDRQCGPWMSSKRRNRLQGEADLLRLIAGNREAVDPHRLHISSG
jgi:hypothetical protein